MLVSLEVGFGRILLPARYFAFPGHPFFLCSIFRTFNIGFV